MPHRRFCQAMALSAGVAIGLVATSAQAGPAQSDRKTTEARAEQRAEATLRRMSLEEKVALLHGQFLALSPAAKRPPNVTLGAGYVPGLPQLGIPAQVATDASLGVANLMDMRRGDVATALPSGMALAATWNPDILFAGGQMIGRQAKAKGFNVMLSGGANLVRDPRAGRNFEYLGEDPLLAGRLVAAQIAGVQSNGIISTIKHFALNDQETGRSSASVEMDEAAMRESDLLAFQLGIEGGQPGAVMCAYNKVGGTFACENRFLLTEVLRRDWGFRGFVMSDWGAVHSTGALLAGLDQQQGEQLDRKLWLSAELLAAVKAGTIPEAAVDRAARRVLWALYAKGVGTPASDPAALDYDGDAAVAQRAAEEAIVLLKNEGGLLPIKPGTRKILVVGGHADLGVPAGGGSSQVTPVGGFRQIEPLKQGPAAFFGRRVWGGTPPLDALRAAWPDAQVDYLDGSDHAAAAQAASAADLVLIFAEKFSTEAMDQPDLSLDGDQDRLIAAVAGSNPRTVVVLETGNAVAMPWLAQVPAVLAAWYPGQRGGAAIAAVLSGKVNPSGRLPVTFPADLAQLPNPVLPGSDLPPPSKEDRATYGVNTNSPPFTIRYPEGANAGYRWFDQTRAKPLFAFGHGLSYTTFAHDGLQVSGGDRLTVRVRVTNTGSRAGAEVVQIYAAPQGMARRLVAWEKVQLEPGKSRDLTMTADPRLLARFDSRARRWIVRAGQVQVAVARSAADAGLTANVRLNAMTIKP